MAHPNPPSCLTRQAVSLHRLCRMGLLAGGALTTVTAWAAATPAATPAVSPAASPDHASLPLALAGLACVRAGAWLTRRVSS